MKGTFFSADFVTDNNDNLRLLEINTDTGYANSSTFIDFYYTEFINMLSANNITEVHIVYKPVIQSNLFHHLSDVLTNSAPFITTISSTEVNGNSIFPTSPIDSDNIFILRMAYDETAILDSEYAKSTLNLLKLFADNNDTESIVNFYHSSSIYGNYNTLDNTFNSSNVPDLVVKPVLVDHSPAAFYKIGKNEIESSERLQTAISLLTDENKLIQQYTLSPTYETNNKISSIRSYHIVYGSNLNICTLVTYELVAMFELPTSLETDNTKWVNLIPIKHYYEFATNTIATPEHGLLSDELVVTMDGSEIPIATMQSGTSYPSYFVADAPNTDDDDLLAAWSFDGNTLPIGSYPTSSVCVDLITFETHTNAIVKLTFDSTDTIELGGVNRLLVHNDTTNKIEYTRVGDLNTNYSVFDASANLIPITNVEFEILEEPTTLYVPNMEDVDTFLVGASGGKILKLVSHNLISCFVAGTHITMEDGSTKNIEDVKAGDVVLSWNEATNEKIGGVVSNILVADVDSVIKIKFEDGTTITTTDEHPFYIDNGWVKAKDLIVGNICTKINNLPTKIESIIIKEKTTKVYNLLDVTETHTFYANNILVHNK